MEKYPPYQSIFAKLSYGESQMLDKAFYEEEVKRLCLAFEQQVWWYPLVVLPWYLNPNPPLLIWVFVFFAELCSSIMAFSLHTWGWGSRRLGTLCGYLSVWLRIRNPECMIVLSLYFNFLKTMFWPYFYYNNIWFCKFLSFCFFIFFLSCQRFVMLYAQ